MKSKIEKLFVLKSMVKLIAPMLLAIFLLTINLFFYIVPTIKTNLLAKKKESIRELVQIVHSEVVKFYNKEKSGEKSRNEAQKAAMEHLRNLRYGPGNKDYFWVNDYLGNKMVMHPYRSELEGVDISDLTDPNGKKIFLEFAKTVKKSGAGFVDYMWQWQDDKTKVVPKISYVKGFKPWGWIIGTGIYVEDVTAEIKQIIQNIISANLIILAIISGLLFLNVYLGLKAQKKSEEKIIQTEKKYQDLMDSVPVGVYSGEPGIDGRLLVANKALAQMFGFDSEKKMIGGRISDLYINAKNREKLSNHLIKKGNIFTETEVKTKSGKKFWISINAKLIKHGKQKYFNGIIENVTKRKVAEQKLKKSFEKLKELTKIKDHFFSVATHELRTPLTVIKMNSGMLLDENISKDTKEQIQDIYESSDRLISIINDMLDLSRIESGKMSEMKMEKIDLKKLTQDIEKNFAALAAEKNVTIKSKLKEKDLPLAIFNEGKLRQIFNNLIGNALKYAGENINIEIDAHHKNKKIEIHVSDNGRGIEPHMHDKIFEKFGMIEQKGQVGTGLGLAFCKEIIEMVGEKIWVESKLGNGARFIFTLAVE